MNSLKNSLTIEAYGVKLSFRSNSSEALEVLSERLHRILPYCHTVVPGAVDEHRFTLVWNKSGRDSLYENGVPELLRKKRDEILERLDSRIRLTVAEFAVEHVFIHAGVVLWKGKAIVLPGRSYAGKSTLTSALVERGAVYYSDEYAIITKAGMVVPFLKPLTLRTGLAGGRTTFPTKGHLDEAAGLPASVALVIFTTYKNASKWRPKRLSKANGVFELIKDSISVRQNPVLTIEALKRMSLTAAFFKSRRGEAKQIAGQILDMCETTAE